MKKELIKLDISVLLILLSINTAFPQSLNNTSLDGYRGIWFELNQKFDFGDKKERQIISQYINNLRVEKTTGITKRLSS